MSTRAADRRMPATVRFQDELCALNDYLPAILIRPAITIKDYNAIMITGVAISAGYKDRHSSLTAHCSLCVPSHVHTHTHLRARPRAHTRASPPEAKPKSESQWIISIMKDSHSEGWGALDASAYPCRCSRAGQPYKPAPVLTRAKSRSAQMRLSETG